MLFVLLVSGCTDDPEPAPTEDAGVDAGPNCPTPTGDVVTHQDSVNEDETWAGDGRTHVVVYDLTVYAPATLTIEACADVRLAPRVSILVRGDDLGDQDARIVVAGEPGREVHFGPRDEGTYWGAIRGYDHRSPIEVHHAIFEDGGNDGITASTISAAGANDAQSPSPILMVDHVGIRGSQGHGVSLDAAGAFTPDSTDLEITGSGTEQHAQPVALVIRALESLPTGSYTGNLADEILVHASLDIWADETFPNRGVPIRFQGGRVLVGRQSAPYDPVTLTIEAGLELRFDGMLILGVGSTGGDDQSNATLLALGTEAEPIVFTSSAAERAPGDWPGIWLKIAVGSRLEHVRIEYAGGPSGISSSNCKPAGTLDDAALILGNFGDEYVADGTTLRDSTISNSAGHAINAVWLTAEFGPDVTPTNLLETYVGCAQTHNSRITGCGGLEGCEVD